MPSLHRRMWVAVIMMGRHEQKKVQRLLKSGLGVFVSNRNVLKKKSARGGSILEFALTFPLLFLLVINVLNFAGFFYAWITVSNATRAGAQYMIMSDTWISGLSPPSVSQVSALIAND